jgi:hypothetical protein
VFFTDWFKPKIIHVEYTVRPYVAMANRSLPRAESAGPLAYTVTFALHRGYRLTAIKVVALDDLAGSNPPALWHVTAPGRTPPVRGFAYGTRIPGMSPLLPGEMPRPLQPGVSYRLFVEAGRYHGECDFKISPGNTAGR